MTTKTPEELTEALDKALASITALENKNKELLKEKQKAAADADEARELAEEAAADKAREAKDVDAIEKRLTDKHNKELARLKGDLDARDAQLSKMLIDNAIATALTQHNVAPQFAKAVTAMLKMDAKIENGEAMLGDVAINDGITAYFGSDEGKAFVAAPANSGAAAMGSKGTTITAPDKWNMTTFVNMKADNPEGAKAFAQKHGFSHLL